MILRWGFSASFSFIVGGVGCKERELDLLSMLDSYALLLYHIAVLDFFHSYHYAISTMPWSWIDHGYPPSPFVAAKDRDLHLDGLHGVLGDISPLRILAFCPEMTHQYR
jgi:hypothetical protein